MKIVNKLGLEQIKNCLEEFHKRGSEHFTDAMLQAWAADVERSLQENDRAEFEIRASESINGQTILCRLSENAYDKENEIFQ